MAIENVQITVPHNYKCRPYQEPFFQAMRTKKRAVLCWHRRAGKDKACWNYLISKAVQKVGIYYYIFPDNRMAKRILWDGIDKDGFKTLEHIPEKLMTAKNNTEMKISLRNGSLIMVLGSLDVNSLRGPNPIGVVFSEYSEQSPMAWQVISPILRENGGWAVVNYTPKGNNHAKSLHDMAKYNDDWFEELLTVEDTGAISLDEINKERAEGIMSEDMIQQEYYCSYTLGIEGSYYAKYVHAARGDNRIGKVPHDKSTEVYTAWDIGYGDSTAIVFYQLIGNSIQVIDFYENHGEGLPHYASILRSKPYLYADHFAPHDIEAHDFSMGLSAKEVGSDLGIRFHTLPTLKVGLEAGIEAVRSIFPRIYIDEKKCGHLIKCLDNYRKEFDEHNNVYKLRPVHNWASHACDSFRYMAIAVKSRIDGTKSMVDDAQAERWFKEYNPRFD